MAGEELADNAPDDRAPCRSVEGDEEAGEDDHSRAGGWSRCGSGVVEREGADGGENQEIDCHANTAYDQSVTTTETLDDVEPEECHAEVDAAKDHGCHEAVVDASGLEDCCSKVEKKIGAGKLL